MQAPHSTWVPQLACACSSECLFWPCQLPGLKGCLGGPAMPPCCLATHGRGGDGKGQL